MYDLTLNDYPREERKIADFYDDTKAIQYVEYMGKFGLRYGVFDVVGNRLDEE